MIRNNIDLNSLIAFGKASASVNKDTLDLITTNSIQFYGNSYKRHAIMLPQKYQLPFRIDFTAKIDFPAFLIIVGDGHLTFGLSENRKIEDIAKPTGKPNQDNKLYNNKILFDKFVNISITYAFDEMQILIDGEERFYSKKLPYMKAKNLKELNKEGFGIGFAVSKLSTLSIKSIVVTKLDDNANVIRGVFEYMNQEKKED